MIMHPPGWLKRTANVVKVSGAQLIADEVMTGFGRTGFTFACHKEKVIPDFLCLAKSATILQRPLPRHFATFGQRLPDILQHQQICVCKISKISGHR